MKETNIFPFSFFFLILYEPAIPSCLEYPSRKENFQNYSWKALLLLHGATFPERSTTNWHCKEYSYILHISMCVCGYIYVYVTERDIEIHLHSAEKVSEFRASNPFL